MNSPGERYVRFSALLLFVFVVVAARPSPAQNVLKPFEAGSPVNDAVFDSEGVHLYLAVADRDEVWKVDAATGRVRATASAGRGPSALALSRNGRWLACVNRLSGDVTLFDADALTAVATVPCGEAPSDAAALPGGGFIVSNSFSDSATLIDPEHPENPVVLEVPGVPNAVAAAKDYVAVAGRVPPALHLFAPGARTSVDVPLPGTPVAVAALADNRFAVATQRALVVIDAETRAVEASRPLVAEDIAAAGGSVYALTKDAVIRLDVSLADLYTLRLAGPGQALAVSDESVAVASPQEGMWQAFVADRPKTAAIEAAEEPLGPVAAPLDPELTLEAPATAAEEPVELEPIPEPIELEIEPATPAPEAPSKPVARPSGRVLTPATAPEAPAPEVEETAEGEPEEVLPPGDVFRRMPLGLGETRAPRASGRPSAIPIPDFSEPSFGDALRRQAGLGPQEGGFEAPVSFEFLENLEAAGELTIVPGEGGPQEIEATDNVRLSLDNMDFAADYFYYSAVAGRFETRGEVKLTQDLSTLDADSLTYELPAVEDLAREYPAATPEELERMRLSLGRLHAVDLKIHEPGRDFEAGSLDYDLATDTGEVVDFRGRAGIYYFGGQRVRVLGPASAEGEDVWITTCDLDPPHYRIRINRAVLQDGNVVVGKNARLQLGRADTPVYWPRWAHSTAGDRSFDFDFDSGHSADIGYYVNVGQQFAVNPDVSAGFRFFPTSKEGVGFGLETDYDFMESPDSRLFRSKGEARSLYTTEDRGYLEWYHRQELRDPDAVLRLQAEQWSDQEFYKDFFYDSYRNRTTPRTFANLTYTKPEYIATGTARFSTHGFARETERMPEVTFHLLERRLAEDLYFRFDTINGYNEREPGTTHALRTVNVARLTYDWNITESLNVTPFIEADLSWYSHEPDNDDSNFRFSNLTGITLQTRFHRSFPGAFGFSGFKHVVVPSVTYSYRPEATMGVEETPRFDVYDSVYGRSRLESKIDNIVFGRDALSKDVWQVARLTLYQGTDFSNELRKSDDYELELDLRPRPYWGWLLAGEHHSIANEYDLDEPYLLESLILEGYERIVGKPLRTESSFQYNAQYGDYDRLLTYLYYDNRNLGGKLNGRVGYAYTETLDRVYNREVLYGVGYRLGEKWGVAFEQRYDFERGELTRQEYEISRDLHCWEATVQVRDRESGWDFGLELSIKAFPGTGVKF